jgi:hypothetical protein
MRRARSHTDLDPDVRAIVMALAHYLIANPSACDSIEGMQRWWFDQEPPWPKHQLETATRWMQARRLIEESVGSDGRTRYRRVGSEEAFGLLLLGSTPARSN